MLIKEYIDSLLMVVEDAMTRARDHLSAIKRGEKSPSVRLNVVITHSLIAGTLFTVLLSAFLYVGWYIGNRLQQIIACSVPFLAACGYVFVVFLTAKKDP